MESLAFDTNDWACWIAVLAVVVEVVVSAVPDTTVFSGDPSKYL